jgi:glycosyltransferase involved in cell wall biosynthesis
LTPLEAMACGTPVVAADASCTPEVVGDAALLVAPDDVAGFGVAMQRVLTESDLARDLRERGLRRAAQFTWARTATATYAVYQQAMRTRARAATTMTGEQPMEIAR